MPTAALPSVPLVGARRGRSIAAVVAAAVALGACGAGGSDGEERGDESSSSTSSSGPTKRTSSSFPAAPSAPPAPSPSPDAATDAIDRALTGIEEGRYDFIAIRDLGSSGDARHAWFVTALLRFFGGDEGTSLLGAFEQLTGVELEVDVAAESAWQRAANHLIAWDTPAYPDLRDDTGRLLVQMEPAWAPFFADQDADIDWRYVSWGGVLIDDRPLGDPDPCEDGCIPALDDPATTPAEDGDWYDDDAIVFGLVEDGEALAIPKNIAEVHEMFNLTLGGRRFAVPYCTLCGSAQAYRTDDPALAEQPVLRTSGLLSRSNKVMYDLVTSSVFDTFTGAAVSGPLQDEGVVLEEVTVVRSTWGAWKADHPGTRIVAEDGGIGRAYETDPLGGRDDDGPIFPIGAADDRLPVQELVVGVIASDGSAIAYPADAAGESLDDGDEVVAGGVALVADGDGLRAVDADTGEELAAHEAFWFAWSQFHPDTALWEP